MPVARGPSDAVPADRLWRDPSVFQQTYERSAAATLAVARSLARGDAGVEGVPAFLGLHGRLNEASPATLGAIWSDPYAYFWARVAHELRAAIARGEGVPRSAVGVARASGSDEPRAVLAAHLAEFAWLVVGAAVLEGTDLELPRLLPLQLPMAIPGTRRSLVGAGPDEGTGAGVVELAGVLAGRPRLRAGEARTVACPVARAGEADVPLQPHLYRHPGLAGTPPAGRTTLAWQAARVPILERGLAMVGRHQPETLAAIARSLRSVALNPLAEMGDLNFVSDSMLRGAFALLELDNPWVTASISIHEFHHNRFFCVEELDGMLEADGLGTDDDALYYSPWREEPRPLRGILHGLYVYVPEGRYWMSVAGDPETAEPGRRLARDRVVRMRLSIDVALSQLGRFARFTPRGKELYGALAADAQALVADARAAFPGDAPATYIETDGAIVEKRSELDGRALTSRGAFAEQLERYSPLGRLAWGAPPDVDALDSAPSSSSFPLI